MALRTFIPLTTYIPTLKTAIIIQQNLGTMLYVLAVEYELVIRHKSISLVLTDYVWRRQDGMSSG